MSADRDRLAALAGLAAMLSERSLVPVAAAQARADLVKHDIAALTSRRSGLRWDGADPVQAALLARQAERLRHDQADALRRLARAEAELEIAKSRARPAFGRKQVLEQLLAASARSRPGRGM